MDNKETHIPLSRSDILLYDDEYFKHIFKKTEKIAAAVFYITRADDSVGQKDTVIIDIEDSARALLETSHKALRATRGSRHTRLEDLRMSLIALESKIVIGVAARCITDELAQVFRHEMVSVHRALRDYLSRDAQNPFGEDEVAPQALRTKRKLIPSRGEPGVHTPTQSPAPAHGRREHILSIIKDKGEATIKDVSQQITDCSEKTIQRELMSLIKDGVLVKEGERRWSKYKVV